MTVSQFNMKWVEQAGLVKFDFLGLKTLTVLDVAVKLIRRRGIEFDLSRIPLDDAKSYEMLPRGDTVGVFQVESAGMRRALVDMKPDRFEDIVALVALYRPGPMANIPTYCARKLGKEPVEYLHPVLKPILEPTYGIITYQEQVQQIARDMAGYTLAEADLLRRAMGKKIKAEMDAQRGRFMQGAAERGHIKEAGHRDLRCVRQVRRIRLQQVALGALCADHLPDGLSQGELPGRVHGRVADAGQRQHRQDRRVPPRGDPPRRAGRGAGGQPLRRRVRRRLRRRRQGPHPLFAGRAQGRRRGGGRSIWSRRAATSRSATSPISAGASIRRSSTSACWRA